MVQTLINNDQPPAVGVSGRVNGVCSVVRCLPLFRPQIEQQQNKEKNILPGHRQLMIDAIHHKPSYVMD